MSNDLLEIPIIARGKVIMPGADAVEFKGRGRAAFRQADPHKHIHDLVLGDTSRLRDLHDTPMAEIIEVLAELGKRLSLDDNPLLQESFQLALKAGGLAEPILRGVYDALPHMFDPKGMTGRRKRSGRHRADRIACFRRGQIRTSWSSRTAPNAPA